MDEIENKLDQFKVPGNGSTWDRVLEFAKNYTYYNNNVFNEPLLELDEIIELSGDQQKAWDKISKWLYTDDKYFVLRGYAGSGKSFLLKKLLNLKLDVYFTAPTNKAAKVLSKFTKTDSKTIYSLLGIRMVQKEDKLELSFSPSPPYFSRKSIIVIDETSMIGEELFEFIKKTVDRTGCKILFVGDPAQLPPVGEPYTKAWRVTKNKEHRAFMKQVIRYDNQLLSLATKIRENLGSKNYYSPIIDDNADGEGVFLLNSKKEFNTLIKNFKKSSDFLNTKVIAWRNKTVNYYNSKIRENLGFTEPYEKDDIVLIAEPVERDGQILATIDDEYVVQVVEESSLNVVVNGQNTHVPIRLVTVMDDEDSYLNLFVAKDQSIVDRILSHKANIARDEKNSSKRRLLWKDFWETKNQFHKIRYGYAITAHRAQGSSYKTVFVDQQDILVNSNKREAMRCLYVACTRSTESVITF